MGLKHHPRHLRLYLRDVDASYRRALELGGEAVQPPVQKEGDPDRRGGVKDPAGNTWWLSTQVGAAADLPFSAMSGAAVEDSARSDLSLP